MRVVIQPPLNQLRFEELVVEIPPGTVPVPGKGERQIAVIRWDGQTGTIEYTSAVPGAIDIEHFQDPAVLQPYLAQFRDPAIAAFDVEQKKLDERSTALAADAAIAAVALAADAVR